MYNIELSWPLLSFMTVSERLNRPTMWLLGVVLVAVALANFFGWALKRQPEGSINPAVLHTINQRVRAWWMTTPLADTRIPNEVVHGDL